MIKKYMNFFYLFLLVFLLVLKKRKISSITTLMEFIRIIKKKLEKSLEENEKKLIEKQNKFNE